LADDAAFRWSDGKCISAYTYPAVPASLAPRHEVEARQSPSWTGGDCRASRSLWPAQGRLSQRVLLVATDDLAFSTGSDTLPLARCQVEEGALA
jgi:hypothetical protein